MRLPLENLLPETSVSLRPAALALLLLGQLLFISLAFDADRPALGQADAWFSFLSHAGQFAKMLVAVMVFTAMGLWPRLADHLESMQRSSMRYPWRYIIVSQLVSFALFAWCTAALFGERPASAAISDGLVLAWLATMLSTAILWLLSLAPPGYWRRLIANEFKVLLAAFGVGLMAWWLSVYAQTFWTPMSDLTFRLSAFLLELIYSDIHVDAGLKHLGARDFIVSIAPQCSGYEGMGLMAIFTGFYLSVFREDFRFPQAFWLFPIGLVTIWLFNNLRIAALIAIGASFSPAVAIGGFHSQAGWISFIVVIVLTLALAYRIPYFSTVTAASTPTATRLNLPMALLIPFVTLLGATILSSALSADFDWFYPLRVAAVGLALAYCWRLYGFTRPRFRLEPWLAAILVFFIWILLVPAEPAQDQLFERQLQQAPSWLALSWLVLRMIGAVVTVPIAEELLFRGYLVSRLSGQPVVLEGRLAFSWVGLILPSVLFGLLHADWVAGIAAGLVFGLVRYRGDSIKDAVIAHAVTNLLLTAYVLLTGNWSLW